MPDAKSESDSCTFFFRHDVKIFPYQEGNKLSNWDIQPLKMDLILKTASYVQNRPFRPKIYPMSISGGFKHRNFFPF